MLNDREAFEKGKNMKLFKKLLTLLLIASMLLSVVSCGDKKPTIDDNIQDNNSGNETGNTENTDGGEDDYVPVYADYTVTVVSSLGEPLSGVSVFVHEDGSGKDYNVCTPPVATDSEGKAVFSLEVGKLYSAALLNVSQKYVNKSGKTRSDRFVIDSTETTISLEINENYIPARYNLGDIMLNFTLTDIDGNEYELYKLLEEKKAVVLNFWFYGCGPCQSEFPALNTAYNNYKNDIEILAINDHPQESLSLVKNYEKDKGLTLDMPLIRGTYGSRVSLSRFDSDGYPTTIVIDRYGKICFIHVGAVTSVSQWNKLFAYFTSDDYTSGVINGFSDIP